MANERAAVLKFHDATFAPGTPVVKAHERQHWVALEQLRAEADARLEREVAAGVAAGTQALRQRGDELVAERLALLADGFAAAAVELERTVLDLALEIASRVVDVAEPQAFFSRAAEHLQALVPAGSALRIRVHPQAGGSVDVLAERLRSCGVRHLSVVTDPSLPEPRSLVVETPDGEIDLGCAKQLQRVVAEVLRGRTADARLEPRA